jgi:hypothetical protein
MSRYLSRACATALGVFTFLALLHTPVAASQLSHFQLQHFFLVPSWSLWTDPMWGYYSELDTNLHYC